MFVLGLNNRYLIGALANPPQDDESWRALHDEATVAPNHQFDASRKACWAVIIRPGMSTDTLVVTEAPPGLVDRPTWLPTAA